MAVAVIIPAYNAGSTIGRAVRSALAQPEAVEVVVVDDGSVDDTAAAARAADDGSGRLTVLRKPNGGPGSAVNAGLDASDSPYFCVLDSDDFFLAGRLGAIFRTAPPGWDMAADRLFLAEQGREDGPYVPWAGKIPASGRLRLEEFVLGNITDPNRPRTELGYLQPVYRRAFMKAAGVRHSDTMRLGEDYLIYCTALARGAQFVVVDARGYVAVARPDSLSHSHGVADLEALRRADGLLMAEPGLARGEQRALAAHARHIEQKITYRKALEAKASGDLGRTVRLCTRDLGTLVYIADQTARARLGRRRGAPESSSAADSRV